MILLIPVDGPCVIAEALTFRSAQAFVDGYIEHLPLPDGPEIPNPADVESPQVERCLLVNEDGLSRRLRPNPAAAALARRPIVGPAILLTGETSILAVLGPRE